MADPVVDKEDMITADQACEELFGVNSAGLTAAEYDCWLEKCTHTEGNGQLPICECGAEAAGCGGHSAWCPKY